jgi:hypothetical protein
MTAKLALASPSKQIWSLPQLDKDRFYAVVCYMDKNQRQQPGQSSRLSSSMVTNLLLDTRTSPDQDLETDEDTRIKTFLDRLALLFACKKRNSKQTPKHVTATGLDKGEADWTVFIAKNNGPCTLSKTMSDKKLAEKLQNWLKDDNDCVHEDPKEENGMWTYCVNFWSDRINYYIEEFKGKWREIHEKESTIWAELVELNPKLEPSLYHKTWEMLEDINGSLEDVEDASGLNVSLYESFYGFWKRKHKNIYSSAGSSTSIWSFSKCIHYVEMLGMPWSIWKACRQFQRILGNRLVRLVLIDRPQDQNTLPREAWELNMESIKKQWKEWKFRNASIKDGVDTKRDPYMYFHCELQIMSLFKQKNIQGYPFIGCSKLSCEICWAILQHSDRYKTRGSHHKISANCAFPVTKSAEEIVNGIKDVMKNAEDWIFDNSGRAPNLSVRNDTDPAQSLSTDKVNKVCY